MKQEKTVFEKMTKENPEFVDACASLSPAQLDERLAQLAKDSQAIQDAKEADEELAGLKEQVSLAAAPYREAKNAISLKVKYVISLLKEKGGS
jgi:hypothetical protein